LKQLEKCEAAQFRLLLFVVMYSEEVADGDFADISNKMSMDCLLLRVDFSFLHPTSYNIYYHSIFLAAFTNITDG